MTPRLTHDSAVEGQSRKPHRQEVLTSAHATANGGRPRGRQHPDSVPRIDQPSARAARTGTATSAR